MLYKQSSWVGMRFMRLMRFFRFIRLPPFALLGLGIAVCSITLLLAAWRLIFAGEKERSIPQRVGLGDTVIDYSGKYTWSYSSSSSAFDTTDDESLPPPPFNISEYVPGIPKKHGSEYSKTLVVAQMKGDNTTWLKSELAGSGWEVAAFIMDDPTAPLHPPKNKGHEAMAYLTYLIDNYDDLPDIMAFMHAHQFSWHNEEIFEFDAAEMLRRLSLQRVMREGYMNMRCLWMPGCPNWLHPGAISEDGEKREEKLIARAWSEIFPERLIPTVLSGPCCAQFALTRERVRVVPRERFIYYREWLLHTTLRDTMSGRVWEYLWHLIFTGQEVSCPSQNACLCDGFGICFGSDDKVDYYYDTMWRIRDAKEELLDWQKQAKSLSEDARIRLSLDEMVNAEPSPEDSPGILLTFEVEEKTAELKKLKKQALEKGTDPVYRALADGRKFSPGDSY